MKRFACTAIGLLTAAAVALALGAGSPTRPTTYNVRDYGAVGNGSADDTTAFQRAATAAVAGHGTLYLPNGTYRLTKTIDFAPPSGRTGAGIQGESMTHTKIVAAGHPAIRLRGPFGAKFADFTTIRGGISFDVDDAHPSAGQCDFERIMVEQSPLGFSFALGTDRQVSEVSLTSCVVNGAAQAAFRVEGWNALDFVFTNCGATFSRIGYDFERTNSHLVLGGSFSACGTVLEQNGGGNVTMLGTRTEHCKRLADLGPVMPDGSMGITGAPIQTKLYGCSFNSYPQDLLPDKHAVRVSAPGPVTLDACQILSGTIGVWTFANSHPVVIARGSVFARDYAPYLVRFGPAGGLVGIKESRVIDRAAGGAPVGVLP